MRQRVAFLRTILSGHPLVLLDEPFGGLDALTRAAMQDWLLARLATEQRTLLLVTHDVDEAIYLADRVIVLSGLPASVRRDIRIDLPRPRTRALVTEERFLGLKRSILDALGSLELPPS
jgi:ABC-type nitrate/sulfonate/bicarbonate transport system ATPase subunit